MDCVLISKVHYVCAADGLSTTSPLFCRSRQSDIIDTVKFCLNGVKSVHRVRRNGTDIWYALLHGQRNEEVKSAVLTLSPVDVQKSQVCCLKDG